MDATTKSLGDYKFLVGTGEVGELILKHNWANTSIGAMDNWPVSLRTTLANVLHSGFPMFLFWGDDLLCFYNEAFRPSLGTDGKHPSIGKKAIVMWGEIWHIIGPLIQQVLVTGKPIWFEDHLVPFTRNGKVEDIYWTFTYGPAFGEDDKIKGVLVTCMETTNAVLARKEKEGSIASQKL